MARREANDIVAEAKNSVVQAIHGVGDIAGAVADATSHTLVRVLQGTRATGSELGGMIKDTLLGTVQAVAQVGDNVEAVGADGAGGPEHDHAAGHPCTGGDRWRGSHEAPTGQVLPA